MVGDEHEIGLSARVLDCAQIPREVFFVKNRHDPGLVAGLEDERVRIPAAVVADALAESDIPLVLDPVLVSTSGSLLLEPAALDILKHRLLPRATLVTPNLPESEALVGILPTDDHTVHQAAQAFALLGAKRVLFKDGHGKGAVVRDILTDVDGPSLILEAPRQDTRHTHGTGCTLATAIACGLAKGQRLTEAVERAHRFVQNAIRTAPGLGQGHGPLNFNV